MKQRFIPLEKQSKRKRREHHAAQRVGWGGLNPATRKTTHSKTYNRKKSGQWFEKEPLSGFCLLSMLFGLSDVGDYYAP
ncbi:MAG: hypothetical protein LBU32_19300 [Clostridiales bacterium]|nr:hypothetical protein [Clostridiales bacterium]